MLVLENNLTASEEELKPVKLHVGFISHNLKAGQRSVHLPTLRSLIYTYFPSGPQAVSEVNDGVIALPNGRAEEERKLLPPQLSGRHCLPGR